MSIEYRAIDSSQLKTFSAAEDGAYSSGPSDDERTAFGRIFDYERSLAAFEDGKIVGGACYYQLGLSVPGGEVNSGAVTYVFVLPTHRRRGILTELMRRQLEAMRSEGISVAGLHAAESSIYGRFGYGPAAHTETLEIETSHAAFKQAVEPEGSFRLIDDEDASHVFPAVYDRYRSKTPGLFSRDDGWWKLRLRKHGLADGSPGWMKLVYERAGEDVAYAIYSVDMNWQDALPLSTLRVIEMAAPDEESYAAMWHYLLKVDLVRSVKAYSSVDPPLWWMLADRRRLKRQVRDGLWIRLVDIPRALESRKYLSDGSVVFEVADDFCPWNSGTYKLESSGGKPSCKPSTETPHINIGAEGLASCFLGGSSFRTLVAVSQAVEHKAGAAALADQLFGWHTMPMSSAPEPLT